MTQLIFCLLLSVLSLLPFLKWLKGIAHSFIISLLLVLLFKEKKALTRKKKKKKVLPGIGEGRQEFLFLFH